MTARKRPHCTKKVRFFCDCRLPDDGQEPMAFCCKCKQWFHQNCRNISGNIFVSKVMFQDCLRFVHIYAFSVHSILMICYKQNNFVHHILMMTITNAMGSTFIEKCGPPWIYRGPNFSRWNIFCSKILCSGGSIFFEKYGPPGTYLVGPNFVCIF